MPTVPVYNNNPIQTAALPAARSNVELPVEAFGGGPSARGVSEGIIGFAEQAQKEYQKEYDRANKARVIEERRALNNWELKNVYAPPDPKTGDPGGAINRIGKSAFGIEESLQTSYDKFYADREKELANEDQRIAVGQLYQSRRESILRWANGHVARQRQVVEGAEFTSGLESSKERASVDPANIPIEREYIKQQVLNRSQEQGWGEEKTKQELQKHDSDLHARVITSILASNAPNADTQAQAYFNKVKDVLDPDVKTQVSKVLEEGTLRGESQRTTDQIVSKTPTLTEALDQVRAIQEPKLRDETQKRVKDFYATKKVAETEANEAQYQYAANIVEKTKDRNSIPEATWLKLSLSEKNAIDARVKQLRQGIQPETNWNKYYELKTLASYPATKDKFLTENLMVYRSQMADPEFKELLNLQASLRKGDDKADKALVGFRTTQTIVNDALKSADIKPSPKEGSDDAKSVDLFKRAVDDQILLFKESHAGKAPGTEEVQKIVDNLMVEGIVKDSGVFGFFQKKRKLFEAKPGEVLVIEKDSIPRTERLKIEEALRRNGKPVTDDAIIELWNRKVQGGIK